jgi:hypothetical protein
MPGNEISREKLVETALKLWDYCLRNDFSGYDPYDALNSRLLKIIPGSKTKLFRLAITQLLKRLPVNLRPLLLIPRTQNPKALAIFLKTAIRLKQGRITETSEQINYLINCIVKLRADGPYYCWGYNFPWQTRGLLVPRGAPNLVCTFFVADALLDAYDYSGNQDCLEIARSAADYFLNELYWFDSESAGFSYPQPGLRIHIYNADLLAAALLSRIYHLTKENKYFEPALKVARYVASRQNEDGSWFYGETPQSRWIDNFHTGYNLMALKDIVKYTGQEEFTPIIRKGFEYYRQNFFNVDGIPKYYSTKLYPIDSHSIAQSIITLEAFRDQGEDNHRLAMAVMKWALDRMWSKKGYFYYQKHRFYTNKISYVRWSQAWMLLALATFLECLDRQCL